MSAFISAKSSRSDTKQATRELVDAVGSKVSFALVYADEKHDLAVVESTLKAAWGSAAIVGCSTSGEITADGAHEGSIVVLAAVGDGFQASTALARGVMNDPEGAARDLVRQLESKKGAGKHQLIVVHTVGFTVQQSGFEHQAFPTLQKAFPNAVIVGGSAGDGLKFLTSNVLADGRTSNDAIAALIVTTDRPIASSLEHGYRTTGSKVKVTASKGAIVTQFDGKKAVQRYAELLGSTEKELTKGISVLKVGSFLPKKFTAFGQSLGMTPKKMLDELPFYQHTLRNPFGSPTAQGTPPIIIPKLIHDDGSIEFFTPMPVGTELEFMKRDEQAYVSATERAIGNATEKLGVPAEACLIVECAGRKMVLDKRLPETFANIRAKAPKAFAGFYSHGEQGEAPGVGLRCNNYSVVALTFG